LDGAWSTTCFSKDEKSSQPLHASLSHGQKKDVCPKKKQVDKEEHDNVEVL